MTSSSVSQTKNQPAKPDSGGQPLPIEPARVGGKRTDALHGKDVIDEAIEGSFPASDPPARASTASGGPATDDKLPRIKDPSKLKGKAV